MSALQSPAEAQVDGDLPWGPGALTTTVLGAAACWYKSFWERIITPTIVWSQDFPGGSDSKAAAYNVGDPCLIPGSGRSPGEGNGSLL